MFDSLDQLLVQPQSIVASVLSGSRAYGTAHASSDEDLRGLFVVPARSYLALQSPPVQLADARGDTVYYSLRRALELLAQGNPNLLELLYTPEDCIRVDSPVFRTLREQRAAFISQAVVRSNVGYALGQIRKARGQHKWINQPQPEQAPQREDFCWVIPRAALAEDDPLQLRPIPLKDSGLDLRQLHAANLPHAREGWRLYDYGAQALGVFSGGRIAHRSIPLEDEQPRFAGLLFFHQQAFEQACTEHQNYWTWRRERNEDRWRQQESGELDYDAKNLMHTVRLLYSGLNILEYGEPIVRFTGDALKRLLDIRAGRWSYAQILEHAEALQQRCDQLLVKSELPAQLEIQPIEELLRELTESWERQA